MSRILLVNDEPDLLEVMEMILGEAGHEVAALTAGQRAFEVALTFAPDLIVLDWRLNGITAEEVVRQLRLDPRTIQAPILLISALQDADAKARLLGIDGCLRKPFTGDALVGAVGAILSSPAGASGQPQHGPC
jgi:DNA-binding response OmpR family regulator